MTVMVENNERLIDMMSNGQIYGYRERTTAEISLINASKRNKLLVKGGASIMPTVGATSTMMLKDGVSGGASVQVPSSTIRTH
jgi:hypothetical protein